MDLNEILIFIKVVQAGSFSGAAKQLDMPNSTVSTKVSALEKRLGVMLLHRTTRKLQTTEAGRLFFEKSLKNIDELKMLESEISSEQGELRGHLKITAPAILGRHLLPDVAARYSAIYPKVQLEFILTDRLVDLIDESVDVALRAGELKDSTLISKKVGVSYFALFASHDYVKKHMKNSELAHPKNLSQHRLILFTPLGREKWQLVGKNSAKVSLNVDGAIISDDLAMIKELVLRGEGIALLPTFMCHLEAKSKELVRLLPDWRSDVRPINFVYLPQKFVVPRLQAFINMAAEELKAKLGL